jgi:hypothetical protein
MLKFIRTLRKLKSPLFDKTFHLLQLEAHLDWDNDWDTDDFMILAHWFFHNDTFEDYFDWDTNLQYMKNIVFFVPDTKDTTLILILVIHLVSTQKMKLLLLILPRLFLLLIPLVLQQMQFFLLFTKLLLLLQFQPHLLQLPLLMTLLIFMTTMIPSLLLILPTTVVVPLLLVYVSLIWVHIFGNILEFRLQLSKWTEHIFRRPISLYPFF